MTLIAPTISPPEPPPAIDHARRIEELGRIIMAYSEVTERLQRSQEQLQRTVVHLNEELGEKNRQLERRNRLAALGEMAAGMAHEIRNPLGGIQLYASLLAKDVKQMPASLQLVNKISAGVKRLEALVSQVLQFTREMTARTADTDVSDVIDQAIELAGQTLTSRGVTCEADGPRPLVARVDPLLLGQAMLNLVLNAAEAMEPGGSMVVRWKRDAGDDREKVRIEVRDTGPGIPPAVMDKLFNPFFTTKDNGTGLGLAIVHRVIEAHDGTIAVSNVEPRGARFELRL
jgi:two-component system sensor histidine kinase HydH